MLTIDICLWVSAIMLTRYLSLSISTAAPLKLAAAHESDRVRMRSLDVSRDLRSGTRPVGCNAN